MTDNDSTTDTQDTATEDTNVPTNSRYTTPVGSRPGSPTPYSRGQHHVQEQEDTSVPVNDGEQEGKDAKFESSTSSQGREALLPDDVTASRQRIGGEKESGDASVARD